MTYTQSQFLLTRAGRRLRQPAGGGGATSASSNIYFNQFGGSGADTTNHLEFFTTCGGPDRLGLVLILGDTVAGGADDITSVLWTTIPLSLVAKAVSGFPDTNARFMYLYAAVAVPTGGQTIIIDATSTHDIYGMAFSYVGVEQTTPIYDVTTNHSSTATATTLTTSLGSVLISGWWTILFEQSVVGDSSAASAGTNSTLRASYPTLNNMSFFDSAGGYAGGALAMTTTRSVTPTIRGINHIMAVIQSV